MKRPILLLALLCAPLAAAPPTLAQTQTQTQSPAPATMLHLSESGRVTVRPDELVATLRAVSGGASSAAVQAKVNALMEQALAQAKSVPGVTVATGPYQVWRGPQAEPWHAEQSLTLRGREAAPMLDLVGRLQTEGLATAQLDWVVTPETARKARAEATRLALAGLRARADEAAGILGLSFVRFSDVRLDGTPPPMPMPRMAVAMAAAPPAKPPSAVAEDETIEATVTADAVLLPK